VFEWLLAAFIITLRVIQSAHLPIVICVQVIGQFFIWFFDIIREGPPLSHGEMSKKKKRGLPSLMEKCVKSKYL